MHYGDRRFDEISYQIYDFTQADMNTVQLKEIRIIAAIDHATEAYKKSFKVAIVSRDSHITSITEEYALYLSEKNSGWQVSIFPDRQAALAWCEVGL